MRAWTNSGATWSFATSPAPPANSWVTALGVSCAGAACQVIGSQELSRDTVAAAFRVVPPGAGS